MARLCQDIEMVFEAEIILLASWRAPLFTWPTWTNVGEHNHD